MNKLSDQINNYRYKKTINKFDAGQLKNELDDLKKQNAELKTKIKEINARNSELEKDYAQKAADSQAREEAFFARLDEDLKLIYKQGIELDNKQALLKNKYKNDVEKLKSDIVSLNHEQQELFEKHSSILEADFNKQQKTLEDAIKEKEEALDSLENDYQTAIADMEEAYGKLQNEQDAALASLRDENNRLQKEYMEQMSSLDLDAKEIEETFEQEKETLKLQSEEDLAKTKQENEDSLALMRSELLALNQEKESLKRQLSEQNKQFELHEKRLQDDYSRRLENFQKDKKQAELKKDRALADYAYKVSMYDEEKAAWEKETEAYRKQLNALYLTLKEAKTNKEKDYNLELSKTQKDYEDAYNAEALNYQRLLERQKAEHESHMARLQKELERKKEDLENLNQSLAAKKKQLEEENEIAINDLRLQQATLRKQNKHDQDYYHEQLQKRNEEVKSLKERLTNELSTFKQKIADDLNILNSDWLKRKENIITMTQDANKAIAELKKLLSDENSAHQEKVMQMDFAFKNDESDLLTRIANLNSEIEDTALRSDRLKEDAKKAKLDYDDAMDKLQKEETEAQNVHKTALEEMTQSHNIKMAELADSHQAALATLKSEHAAKIKEMDDKFSSQKTAYEENLQRVFAELNKQNSKLKVLIEDVKEENAVKISREQVLRSDILNAIAQAKKDYEAAKNRLEQEKIDAEMAKNEEKSLLKAEHEATLAKLKADLKNEEDLYADAMTTYKQTQGELSTIRLANEKKIKAMDEQFKLYKNAKQAEIDDLDKNLQKANEEYELELAKQDQLLSAFEKAINAKKQELEKAKQKQSSDLSAYLAQHEAEIEQYALSLQAALAALRSSYAFEQKNHQENLNAESLKVKSDYEAQLKTLDERQNELLKNEEAIIAKGKEEYAKVAMVTQNLKDELAELKKANALKLDARRMELAQAKALQDEELAKIRQGYDESLAAYKNDCLKQADLLKEERETWEAKNDEVQKAIVLEKGVIDAYLNKQEMVKETFNEEFNSLFSAKKDALAAIEKQKAEIIEAYRGQITKRQELFKDCDLELKQLFADKPLAYKKYYDDYVLKLGEIKNDYLLSQKTYRDVNADVLTAMSRIEENFTGALKNKMEELFKLREAEMTEEETRILQISDDYMQKKSEESQRQELLKKDIEAENTNFNSALQELEKASSDGEAAYANILEDLNTEFTKAKLEWQEKMQEKTNLLTSDIEALKEENKHKLDELSKRREELTKAHNEFDDALSAFKNTFEVFFEDAKNQLEEKLVSQQRQLAEIDMLDQKINPLFISKE